MHLSRRRFRDGKSTWQRIEVTLTEQELRGLAERKVYSECLEKSKLLVVIRVSAAGEKVDSGGGPSKSA
jgi:hypothetical protein